MQGPTTPPARAGTPARSRTGPCALGPRRASATPRGRRSIEGVRRPRFCLSTRLREGFAARDAPPSPCPLMPIPAAGLTPDPDGVSSQRRRGGTAKLAPEVQVRADRVAATLPRLSRRHAAEPARGSLRIPFGAVVPWARPRAEREVAATDRTPSKIEWLALSERSSRGGATSRVEGVGLAGFEPARSCARGRRAPGLPNRPRVGAGGLAPPWAGARRRLGPSRLLVPPRPREKSGTVGRSRTSTGRSPPRSERGASAVPPRPREVCTGRRGSETAPLRGGRELAT